MTRRSALACAVALAEPISAVVPADFLRDEMARRPPIIAAAGISAE
jgi:hypothetical protein